MLLDPSDPDYVVGWNVLSARSEVERELIQLTLEKTDGDKPEAAQMLGISLKTLYNRLNAYKEEDEA